MEYLFRIHDLSSVRVWKVIRGIMRIYNTLSRSIEEIVPIEPGKIKMYSCGPTVYRYIHIGNLRTFTMADWMRRDFEYRGFEVLHIKNITDVGHMRQEVVDRGEDKILAQARKEGKTSLQIAQFYTEAFHDDEAKLNILPASIFPRATQHIPEMIAIIAGLLAKGIAYEVNGYIYYDIKRFPGYGKLSGNQLENMLAGVREGVDTDRHNPEDFPLWKPAEEGREMAWDSPWGRGFPGWHIECSAMSIKYLGEHFDIHALYRSRLNFTFRALQAAQTSLERLRAYAYHLLTRSDRARVFSGEPIGANPWRDAFLAQVENDLNIPRAMAIVWNLLRSGEEAATTRLRLLLDFDRILGFDLKNYLQSEQPERKRDPEVYLAAVPSPVAAQVRERGVLRHGKNYEPADQIRHELKSAGYELRDTARGSLVVPRRPEEEFTVISSSIDVTDNTSSPDLFEFSVNLLAHNSREDLERCIQSICRHSASHHIELEIIDNGSTDDTLAYLQQLARRGDLKGDDGQRTGLQVIFADHNLGFAAGRNATMRASKGHYIILMDTSIEVKDNIWEPLAQTLADSNIGVVGPYGLVTDDLRDFREAAGPDVDAIEGYLMAFRRELLPEVGWIDEKFRFYRLMDIYFSFFFKTSGYRAVTTPIVAGRIEKHPHREWYSLSEEERATKSKKNYDIFRARWHHGESLLVANFNPEHWWRGHDHAHHVAGEHAHTTEELPTA